MNINGQTARAIVKDRWIPFLVTVLLSGGTGGVVAWATVPQRLDAIEIQMSNESTYLRGEVRKLGIQVAHATCIAEAALDTAATNAGGQLSRRQRRRVCEEIDRRVQDILEEQVGR